MFMTSLPPWQVFVVFRLVSYQEGTLQKVKDISRDYRSWEYENLIPCQPQLLQH